MAVCTGCEEPFFRLDCPVHTPEHLRPDAMHYTCSGCGRWSWERESWRQRCGVTQPNGARCNGRFE